MNQQFSGPLITTNLSQSHGTGPVMMGFLTVADALLRAALITSCFSGLCLRWIYEQFAWFWPLRRIKIVDVRNNTRKKSKPGLPGFHNKMHAIATQN